MDEHTYEAIRKEALEYLTNQEQHFLSQLADTRNLINRIKGPDSGVLQLCKEIWGGRCEHWVVAPTFSHDDHPTVKAALRRIGDPECPTNLLIALASHKAAAVQVELVGHPNLPRVVLNDLACTHMPSVRAAASGSPRLGPQILARLVDDDSVLVRKAVAGNPNTPPDILTRLAQDADSRVVKAAFLNKNLPYPARIAIQI